MANHRLVSRGEWTEARKALLVKEKEFTRLRDRLSRERRELPWVRLEKGYVFEGADGKETLADLFGESRQLVIYHFMLGPDWLEGCKSCSFWANNFNGIDVHLRQRDVSFLAVSRAPWPEIEAFKKRMGWGFQWVSSFGSDFNYDFHVSFRPEELAAGEVYYNYTTRKNSMSDHAGVSVFYKDPEGAVFHTYSCYARGLDMLNGAYHYLDLVPKGRDEDALPNRQAWVRHHDAYPE